MLRTGVRVLEAPDTAEALSVCRTDPASNVFVSARLQAAGAASSRGGGELWGFPAKGPLTALCWSGANLVPVGPPDPDALDAFAARARREGRRCSSIVGPREATLGLWARLRSGWSRHREVRDDQPLLVMDTVPVLDADPAVRRVRSAEVDALMPACVDMFTEEVGYSPVTADGGVLYRRRVAEIVDAGHAFARWAPATGGPDAQVVFKAELGSVSADCAQVQGVWVPPHLRGRGLAAPGMAAVVTLALAEVAPLVSLYVNSFNTRALASYERVGFRRVGTFATVLF